MFERMQNWQRYFKSQNRMKRGSIDFDFPETKVILDENGKPVDIKPYDRNVATKIIEDFMLLANETVAEDGYWQEFHFYTGPMRHRTKKKSVRWQHLSIILDILCI